MTDTVYRYEVPVDDRWHRISGCMRPLHVGCRKADVVEFWTYECASGSDEYRVYATGQPIEESVYYAGTVISPGGNLVWHLMRRV
jgi:hypothetical protein